ncbi:MAG: hypothetical protein SYR96_13430 [Actinomycetota bacterium]|nr:hypothetical protein [Actinomycetota bacterium]
MIWQGKSTRRPPGVPATRRFASGRPQALCRTAAPAAVIREPEEAWWRTQTDLDEGHGDATTTVAALRDHDAGTDAVMARLAELAADDELLVVCEQASCPRPGHAAVVTRLRGRLPRRDVFGLEVCGPGMETRRQAVTLERALDAGSLPVVVTAPGVLHDVTAEISSLVRADRVLRVFGIGGGADLYQVWRRHPEPSVT